MIMLFDRNSSDGEFCDIKSRAIDAYYIKNLGFNVGSSLAAEFLSVLDTVARLLSDGKRPPLVGHQAIHLVLAGACPIERKLCSEHVGAQVR